MYAGGEIKLRRRTGRAYLSVYRAVGGRTLEESVCWMVVWLIPSGWESSVYWGVIVIVVPVGDSGGIDRAKKTGKS